MGSKRLRTGLLAGLIISDVCKGSIFQSSEPKALNGHSAVPGLFRHSPLNVQEPLYTERLESGKGD